MSKYDQLSRNFSGREFACKGLGCCGGVAPMNPRLVEALQELRDILGEPLFISSGFRCFSHNSKIGSTDGSQHPRGTAADVWCHGKTPRKIAAEAENIEAFRQGGLGIYNTFVHLDVREGRVRW